MTLDRRTLGGTGLTVTRIGLGLAALGRPGYINLGRGQDFADRSRSALAARSGQILNAAYDAGIRYFDAARSYGLSERFLSEWMAGRPVADAVIGSKWGYEYTAGWRIDADIHEQKEHSLDRLCRQWAESRVLLGERLDLYQIHSATFESGVLTDVEVLTELASMKAEGTAIGLSVSGPNQGAVIDAALEIEIDGGFLFDTVQATWNVLERSAGPALSRAHAAGRGVIVKEALANGRLTDRNLDCSPLVIEAARTAGLPVDALALATVLAQPWADTALSGAVTIDQLNSNLMAVHATVADDLVGCAETSDVYWRTRSALPWG